MCDPVSMTMAVAGVASAAIGGVFAANQADAAQKSANYNAQVAQNNAVIAGQQRSVALQQGQEQVQQSELHQSQLLGEQKAALAANGVALDSGSAVDQLATTKFLGAQDVNAIQSNAARQAWGYEVQGSNDTAQSNLDKWQARNTNPAGIGVMAGSSSLLSSASMYAAGNTKQLNSLFGKGGWGMVSRRVGTGFVPTRVSLRG
jgi:hypothetical protein